MQTVLQGVIQRDFDDRRVDEHLGGWLVQALQGGFDFLELGAGAPHQDGVIELVRHHANPPHIGRHHALGCGVCCLVIAILEGAGIAKGAGAAHRRASAIGRGIARIARIAPGTIAKRRTCTAKRRLNLRCTRHPAQTRCYTAVSGSCVGLGGTEDTGQHTGQVLRITVLNAINEQLRFSAVVAGLVELFDPSARLLQIGCARCHHQDAVEPLHRHDSQGAKQRVAFAQHGGRRCRRA